MDQHKTCTACDTKRPVTDFHKGLRGKYGVVSVCKDCCRERAKSRYNTGKEQILERNAKWRQENKEKCCEYTRRWRENNPEQSRESTRQSAAKWRSENPERARALVVAYQKRNPEKMKALWRRREKIIRRATPMWANHFFIEEAYHIANVRAQMLGGQWHVDHIIPLQGKNVCGLHVENNLQVIRSEVNLRKGNKFFEEYAT